MVDIFGKEIQINDTLILINKNDNFAKRAIITEIKENIIYCQNIENSFIVNLNDYIIIVDSGKYFITCMSKLETNKSGWLDTGSCRTFGYVNTYKEAIDVLHNNICDMHEYLYNYAVVERMQDGIHPICMSNERQFFKYDKERSGFFEIEEPECCKNSINFAIG